MKSKLAKLAYTPQFFDPAKADQDYKPDIATAFQEGIDYGRANNLKSAQRILQSGIAHAMMMTDLQGDFRDRGRLPVAGTDAVVLRTCVRLLNGIVIDHFGGIIFSLDGHPGNHISFDHYWRDKDGKALDLSKHGKAAVLTLVDEAKCVFKATAFNADGPYEVGLYQPHFDTRDAVAYWKHLQATGQGDIWVFVPHCVLGTDGTNLHPLLVETISFASGARSMQPTIIHKGHLSNTDWFGPLEPCRPDTTHAQGGFQKEVIDIMKRFRTVEFVGVAEDFCDYNMKRQTMEKLTGTEYLGKLRFVADGTVPIIPNAAHVQKLNAEALKAGVQFINHDTPFEAAV
jgi:nicotinamidase-related amidase